MTAAASGTAVDSPCDAGCTLLSGHLRDEGLRVAQQQQQQPGMAVEFGNRPLGRQSVAASATLHDRPTGSAVAPMNSETPTIPSFPTTEISADAPFSMTYSSETMESIGSKRSAWYVCDQLST